MSGTVLIGEHMSCWRSSEEVEGEKERTSDILNLQISVRSSFSECGVSKRVEVGMKNGRLHKQSFRTTEVSIVYIVPKNYKYNVKYKDHIATKENLLLLAMLQFQRLETQ